MAIFQEGTCRYYGAKMVNEFTEECLKRNLSVGFNCDVCIDLTVNDFKVEIKSARKMYWPHKNCTQYFHYQLRNKQATNCDFVACHHPEENSWFIIPQKGVLPTNGNHKTIYIGVYKSNYRTAKNRYWKYQNAWELLR